MHDTVDLEGRGIPSAFVATREFVAGAAAQAKALGLAPAAVYVPHPIQDRSDAELIAIADAAFDDVVAAIAERGA